VGSPQVDSDFATPGLGNVSSDGVHPSTQGCKLLLNAHDVEFSVIAQLYI
jgi:hypothetical protein